MNDWSTEEMILQLEDEIDASEGLASLSDAQGTVSLEAYLKSRESKPKELK